jgi:uncharacterized protein (DUF58 family)
LAGVESTRSALLESRFLHRLESLALHARKLASGSERGERASDSPGSGIAFSTHRAYAPGDDFRFLDWKLYARSERLYVKQFAEERDLPLHLLVDCSRSMGHGSGEKFRRAQELAAALGYIGLVNLDRVTVHGYAADLGPRTPPMRGKKRVLALLRALAELAPAGVTDLRRAARSLCARAPRSGLAVVISDGFEGAGFLSGIDQLRYGRIEPVVLLVVDARDATLPEDGEVTLVDSESGRERTLVLSGRTRARHERAYRAHFAELARGLRARAVRTASVDVTLPLERALLDTLRRTGVVG